MRRLHALLIAGLMAAPMSAIAGPDDTKNDWSDSKDDPRSENPWSETLEWSMATKGRARLGVMVIGLTPELRKHFGAPEDRGVMIGRVQPGSAAEAAGLAVGDLLTDVKGTAVDSAGDVLSALAPIKKDEAVSLAVIRDGKPLALSAKMLDEPAPPMRRMKAPPWPSWIEEWFRSFPSDRRTNTDQGPRKIST